MKKFIFNIFKSKKCLCKNYEIVYPAYQPGYKDYYRKCKDCGNYSSLNRAIECDHESYECKKLTGYRTDVLGTVKETWCNSCGVTLEIKLIEKSWIMEEWERKENLKKIWDYM